jgi:membrane protein required for colicin V production
MTPFDWIAVLIIVLSAIVAAAQGFLLEVVSLAGLILGLWLALWNYRVLAVPLARHIHSEHVADALGFLLIALGIMVVAGLVGRAISRFAHYVGLGGLDSVLGAIFGIVRGCALVVIAIIAIAAFMPQQRWLRGSKLAPYFLSTANQISAGAPDELRLKIRHGIAAIENVQPDWIELNLHPHPTTR